MFVTLRICLNHLHTALTKYPYVEGSGEESKILEYLVSENKHRECIRKDDFVPVVASTQMRVDKINILLKMNEFYKLAERKMKNKGSIDHRSPLIALLLDFRRNDNFLREEILKI